MFCMAVEGDSGGWLSGIEAALGAKGDRENVEEVRVGFGRGGAKDMKRNANGQKPENVEGEDEGSRRQPERKGERARKAHEAHRLDDRAVKRHFEAGRSGRHCATVSQ
jgi:hypothetical protein